MAVIHCALILFSLVAVPQDDHKKQVMDKIQELLNLVYKEYSRKQFDRCIRICRATLLIDPHYAVAKEVLEDAKKTKHRRLRHSNAVIEPALTRSVRESRPIRVGNRFETQPKNAYRSLQPTTHPRSSRNRHTLTRPCLPSMFSSPFLGALPN